VSLRRAATAWIGPFPDSSGTADGSLSRMHGARDVLAGVLCESPSGGGRSAGQMVMTWSGGLVASAA
jgi:hypothetical protein